jgi:hypothetical protein
VELVDDHYYIICLDYKFSKLYVIWISDDTDRLVADDENKIIAFRTKDELTAYADKHQLKFNEEYSTCNLYLLQRWLLAPSEMIDCTEFLNLWNLFTDVAETVCQPFLGDEKETVNNNLYEKLFDGNGLWISSDPNPSFDKTEIETLQKVLNQGLNLLQKNLHIME